MHINGWFYVKCVTVGLAAGCLSLFFTYAAVIWANSLLLKIVLAMFAFICLAAFTGISFGISLMASKTTDSSNNGG